MTTIDRLTVAGLRSTRQPLSLRLDAPLTLIYAANGTGKTTVCEAAELLLTGDVKRLDTRADDRWRWLRSDGLPDDTPATVDAVVRMDDRLQRLRVELPAGERPELSVDGRRTAHPDLLRQLVPDAAAAGTGGGLRQALLRRRWLRSARFLYDHEIAHLLDDDEARRTLFADLIGVGGIEAQRRVAEQWAEVLRRRADELASELAVQQGMVQRERDALEALVPADPQAVAAHRARLAAALAEVGGPGEVGGVDAVAALRATARQEAGDARARAARLARLATDLAHAPPEPAALDQALADAVAARDAGREAVERLAARLAGLQQQVAASDDGLRRLDGLSDTTSLGELVRLPPSEWVEHLPALARADRPARRRALQAARVQAAEAARWEVERRSLDATLASAEPDLDALAAEVAAADGVVRAAEERVRATAEPLERLAAAVEAVLPTIADDACPACGHGWDTVDALRGALRDNLAPAREVAQAVHREREAVRARQAAAVAALEAGRRSARERAGHRARRDALTAAILRWRAHAATLDLPAEAAVADVDAARDALDRADAAVRWLAALRELGADSDEAPTTLIATVRAELRAVRDEAGPALRATEAAHRDAMATAERAANEADAVARRVAVQGAAWQRLDAVWAALGEAGTPTVAAVTTARRDAEDAARRWAAVAAAAGAALPVLATAREHASRGGALREAQAAADDRTARLARLAEAAAAIDADLDALDQRRRAETRRVLGSLQHSVDRVFRRLQGNPVVDRVDLSVDAILTARAGDAALDLSRQLSRGQRQDLALALFVARARAHGGTCFLDEPFLHLDDLNRAGTLDLLRTLVLQEQGRVRLVITTASAALVRHLSQKLAPVPWTGDGPPLRVLHLTGGPGDGVRVQREVDVGPRSVR